MSRKPLFITLQEWVPQRLLTAIAGGLAQTRISWLKNALIKAFVKVFKVDLSEAIVSEPDQFEHFNAFFTRALKPELRPVVENAQALACPADGAVSQLGLIDGKSMLQAKGHDFTVHDLLGGSVSRAAAFENGSFATIYLSPKDYHRLHMPMSGRLLETIYVPGDLYSVNQTTAAHLPHLFSRNERLVAVFETEVGPMALVLVAAMIVGGIDVVWDESVVPCPLRVQVKDYRDQQINLYKGEEMGRFSLGSTIIVCFGPEAIAWHERLDAGSAVRVGEEFGTLRA